MFIGLFSILDSCLVDPASNYMLVSKIKPWVLLKPKQSSERERERERERGIARKEDRFVETISDVVFPHPRS